MVPKGNRGPLPVELREVQEKLQRGCMATADKLEETIMKTSSARDLAALIRLQFEFAFGKPSTWVERSTGLPDNWDKLTPQGKAQMIDQRMELLIQLRNSLGVPEQPGGAVQ